MQLLIVHHDAEMGEGLRGMVRDYSPHAAEFVRSDRSAHEWLAQQPACDLLLTQLESKEIDGLMLASSLGEQFPRLTTFFLPAYPSSEQRLEVAWTKVFPEPIDGERLLQAIARVEEASGAANLFHIIDLLQMCCLSGKTGVLRLIAGEETGVVFLRNGELRHAETLRSQGLDAIYEMLCWRQVEFTYDANAHPATQTIDIGWDVVLIEAVMREREEQALLPGARFETAVTTALLPPEPDLTGQQIGSYQVGSKLTESFWDRLYRAEQISIGRPVALHVLRSSLRQNPARAQEFLDTASANANIQHPAILPVYEAGEANGTYFYAREFVVGRTLYEIKAHGLTIPELTALRIIRALAEALAHLDDYAILHAPLRLSRIFITPNDEAKLADVAVANVAMAQLAPARTEIELVGRVLASMTQATTIPGGGRVLPLIHQMQAAGDQAIISWAALAQEAKKLEMIVEPSPRRRAPKKTGVAGKVKLWGKRG